MVPLHVLKSLNNLEELEVENCNMLERVFDFEDENDYYNEVASSSVVVPLKKLKLWGLPKLKNVWSNNYQGNIFPSLRSIDVSTCKSLPSIFPALSVAKGMLEELEELQISDCSIDVIVAKDQVSESVAATLQLPRLTSLKLRSLPQLTSFYPERRTIEWPHLQRLSIEDCDELEIFVKEVSSSSEIYEEESTLNSKYPLFSHDKVIHNLEELDLAGKPAEMIGSGQFPMYLFPEVKLLDLFVCNATTIVYRTLLESFPNLEELHLSGDFAEAFEGDDVAALVSPFLKLTLDNISITGSLSPLLVSSPNLTHIEVMYCGELTTLMTSSTARSLVHLTHLSIGHCSEIEEIITKQEGENDEDKEIVFNKLKILVLNDLFSLKRFCGYNYTFRFPLLDQLVIKECRSFTIFSSGLVRTPSLKSIQLSHRKEQYEVSDYDLNKTLYLQRPVVSREVVLDEDDASVITNEQFPQAEILRIRRFVQEGVAFPYTLLERFPKLNELHVKNCSFEEIFPSHAPSSTAFHNLIVLKVSRCHYLVYLLTCSTVKSLVNLGTLEINDCEKLEEIVSNETDEDVEGGITFNGLRMLQLTHLPRLKIQEDKRDFNIEDRAINIGCTNSRSLFSQKKVLLPKLETLELYDLIINWVSLIWDDQHSFSNLKTLIVIRCDSMKLVPLHVLKSLTNLEELKVSYCHNLEMVFGFEDLNDYHKEMKSSSAVVPLSLTHLEAKGCGGMTTLMTSAAATSLVHITHLSIRDCYKIEEIITKQEGEDDEDRKIIFNQMKFLELDGLRNLKRFCRHNYTFRFPLLNELIIKDCRKFKIFSPGLIEAPSLKSVQLGKDREKHEIWDTDLNKILYSQRYGTSGELVLDEDDAIMIRGDQFPADCCPQVEILRIKGFVDEWVTLPYPLLVRFPKLNELHVENCSFEDILPSHAEVVDQIPPFKNLSLANLDQLKNIFPSHAPSSTLFHNLMVLKVFKCHQLVYSVTSSIVKSLVNLETLNIDDCEKLEEIVRNETVEDVEGGIAFNGLRILKLTRLPRLKIQEDKRDFNIEGRATNTRCTNIYRSLFSHNKVLLPKLERLELSHLLNNLLSLIWDDQLLHNSFRNLKTLVVQHCDFMKLVPLRVLKSLNNLEKLEVSYCHKLEMVFGFEDLNDYRKEVESSSVVVPLSLTHLEVKECCVLTTLMTPSAALSFVHIRHLSISNCNQIEEIITKQEGEDDDDKEIIFNQMKFLELEYLPRLKRFCGYNCTFKFPLLEYVTITKCPRLTMFCPGAIHAPRLQSVRVDEYDPHKVIWMTDLNNTIQHLFTFKEVISTIRSMALTGKNIRTVKGVFLEVSSLYVESFTDEGATFPYSSLERFPQLKELYVEHCSFEEIFPSQDQIIDLMRKTPAFQKLCIAYMDKLKSIWKDDSQLPPIHQNLGVLDVKSCCSLVKLAPSSASFKDLWGLSVSGCHQLIHLVTTTTAKSLVHLSWLAINDCKKMEEIVINDTNEDVESEITFNKLSSIKLTDMPSLKMFSPQSHTFEFPILEMIEISGCPEMKKFCPGVLKTPRLSKVKTKEHEMEWKYERDLNKTMEGQSSAKDCVNI